MWLFRKVSVGESWVSLSKQCGTALAALIMLDLGLKTVFKVGQMW